MKKETKMDYKRNVSIVALRDKESRILLVRTKKLSNHWQPIGGGINNGELPIDAAIRELFEETGITLSSNNIKLIIEVPYDFGEGTIYFYDTNITISNDMLKINKEEIEEYKWFTLEEAKTLEMFKATSKFIDTLSTVI